MDTVSFDADPLEVLDPLIRPETPLTARITANMAATATMLKINFLRRSRFLCNIRRLRLRSRILSSSVIFSLLEDPAGLFSD